MDKHSAMKVSVIVTSSLCFFTFLLGPLNFAESAEKGKVVSRKIVPKKVGKPVVRTQKKVVPAPVAKKAVPQKVTTPQKSAKEMKPQERKSDLPAGLMAKPSLATVMKTKRKGLIYNPKGKLDPFTPLYKEKPETGKKPIRRTPRTPLEKIALSQLKLAAVILAESGNRALVEEASGKGYIIKTGTYIGTKSGKVIKITSDRIILEEEVEDLLGNIVKKEKQLKLQKPPGEL